jgi:uncharacterized protein (DUF1778 family)
MPRLSTGRAARKPPRRNRLEARITDEQRALFQRAADLQGRSLSDFVVATVHEKAVQTIESMEIIRLNAEESLKMAKAILNPREPNAKLRAAAKRYMENHDRKPLRPSDRTRPLHHGAARETP